MALTEEQRRKLHEKALQQQKNLQQVTRERVMTCPKCGSHEISLNTFQENKGVVSISATDSQGEETGHGCLWWLIIGWWWWIIDLFLWIVAFVPRLILHLFASSYKKKSYEGSSSTESVTENVIIYKNVGTCQNCGYIWTISTSGDDDEEDEEDSEDEPGIRGWWLRAPRWQQIAVAGGLALFILLSFLLRTWILMAILVIVVICAELAL